MSREAPEVIQQLNRHKDRIGQNSKELTEAFAGVVQMKRWLGMGARLAGIPASIPIAIVSRPALMIGNCSTVQIQEILAGEGAWKPLMDALPSVSSGLILYGGAGGNLKIELSRQTVIFDSSTAG